MNNSLTSVPSKRGFDACLVDRDGVAVAHVCSARDVPLFIAAPELLEALEAIVDGLGATVENDGNKRIWANAFAAIAKARGQ